MASEALQPSAGDGSNNQEAMQALLARGLPLLENYGDFQLLFNGSDSLAVAQAVAKHCTNDTQVGKGIACGC